MIYRRCRVLFMSRASLIILPNLRLLCIHPGVSDNRARDLLSPRPDRISWLAWIFHPGKCNYSEISKVLISVGQPHQSDPTLRQRLEPDQSVMQKFEAFHSFSPSVIAHWILKKSYQCLIFAVFLFIQTQCLWRSAVLLRLGFGTRNQSMHKT